MLSRGGASAVSVNRIVLLPLTDAHPSQRLQAKNYATESGATASASRMPAIAGALALGAAAYFYGSYTREGREAVGQARRMAEEKIDQAGQATGLKKEAALDKGEFRDFKLLKKSDYNHNTASFVFDLGEGKTAGMDVASAVLTKAPGKDGKPVVRPYTPTSTPDAVGQMTFLIKKYPGGAMTEHIHSLKEGDSLQIKGPIPKWPYIANQFDHVYGIAGGTGITPIWQLMQAIDHNPSDKTKVTLLYSNQSEKDILLKEQFDRMAKDKPDQFKIVYAVDKPEGDWKGLKGYLNGELARHKLQICSLTFSASAHRSLRPRSEEVFKTHIQAPGDKPDSYKIFVCGPPPQVEVICGNKKSAQDQGPLKGMLADIGYSAAQIYKF